MASSAARRYFFSAFASPGDSVCQVRSAVPKKTRREKKKLGAKKGDSGRRTKRGQDLCSNLSPFSLSFLISGLFRVSVRGNDFKLKYEGIGDALEALKTCAKTNRGKSRVEL